MAGQGDKKTSLQQKQDASGYPSFARDEESSPNDISRTLMTKTRTFLNAWKSGCIQVSDRS